MNVNNRNSPEMALYDAIASYANTICSSVYDHLPDLDTTYSDGQYDFPVLILGTTSKYLSDNNSNPIETIHMTLDYFADIRDRGQAYNVANKFLSLTKVNTKSYRYIARFNQENEQMLQDNSIPGRPLLHTVIELVFEAHEK